MSKVGKSTKPDSFFDEEQLKDGIKVEMEHTDNIAIAKQIAKDHLEEFSNYYIELEKMEKKLEQEKNS